MKQCGRQDSYRPPDFPKGFGHTSIFYLKSCDKFADAKRGDDKADKSVIRQCVKRNRIEYIKCLYQGAVLLSVLGLNRLPIALARTSGLPVLMGIYIIQPIDRKTLSAMKGGLQNHSSI